MWWHVALHFVSDTSGSEVVGPLFCISQTLIPNKYVVYMALVKHGENGEGKMFFDVIYTFTSIVYLLSPLRRVEGTDIEAICADEW